MNKKFYKFTSIALCGFLLTGGNLAFAQQLKPLGEERVLNTKGYKKNLPSDAACSNPSYTLYDKAKGSSITNIANKGDKACCVVFYRMANGHMNKVMKVLEVPPKSHFNPTTLGKNYYYIKGTVFSDREKDNLGGFGSVTVKTNSADCVK